MTQSDSDQTTSSQSRPEDSGDTSGAQGGGARSAPTDAERSALARAITRANGIARNHDDRFPVTAAVLVDGEVVAWGDNEVHVAHDPTRHAEVVAIANACARLGSDTALREADATLVTTLQPCEMCLGAMGFAGIRRVIFAAARDAVGDRYFMYPGLTIDDFAAASGSGLVHMGGVMQADVLRLYVPAHEARED